MPSWLPLEVLIANTLLVEVAVALAIYWFVVRRAENKRRARFVFVIGAILVASFEGLGALDVLGPRTMHEHVLSRGPLNATFCWETSVVLGRMSGDRSVALFGAPCHGKSSVFVVRGNGLTEELWARLGHAREVARADWPVADERLLVAETIRLPVQVNGKLRDEIEVAAEASEETIRAAALAAPNVRKHLAGRAPKKLIVVPGRLVNVVG